MENFYREKAYFMLEKMGKVTLPPLKNDHLTPLPTNQL